MGVEQQDDNALIELTVQIVETAQHTGDPRVMELMDYAMKQLAGTPLIPTLMLRYGALKRREDELERELERVEDTRLSLRRPGG